MCVLKILIRVNVYTHNVHLFYSHRSNADFYVESQPLTHLHSKAASDNAARINTARKTRQKGQPQTEPTDPKTRGKPTQYEPPHVEQQVRPRTCAIRTTARPRCLAYIHIILC